MSYKAYSCIKLPGHSTKGEHNIHKVNEYMKKHEFYDENHDGGEHEKHGGFQVIKHNNLWKHNKRKAQIL